jgi:hypothetical protein
LAHIEIDGAHRPGKSRNLLICVFLETSMTRVPGGRLRDDRPHSGKTITNQAAFGAKLPILLKLT